MSTFRKPQFVHLSPEAVSRARAFASSVSDTVDYCDRNQTQLPKISDDHFVSKLGEEAVRLAFEARQRKVKSADYSIYASKKKSWTADLIINELEVAIKTQRRSLPSDTDSPGPFRLRPDITIRSYPSRKRGSVWSSTRIWKRLMNASCIPAQDQAAHFWSPALEQTCREERSSLFRNASKTSNI